MATKMNNYIWQRDENEAFSSSKSIFELYQDQLYGEPEGWAVCDYELFKELYYKKLNRLSKFTS